MRALLVAIGMTLTVAALAATDDSPSTPDAGRPFHRWQCGACVCCTYGDDKTVHTDCPGDPIVTPPGVCACCDAR
jgi:hypothetical protein